MKNIIIFCCVLLAAAAMQAQVIHVPGDYPSIQQGITAANPGDTVLVAEGTYFEQISFLGKKPLTVASEFLMDGDTSHIGSTIVDGSQLPNPDSATVVYFVSGEDTTSILCGFTIRGGKGTLFSPPGFTIRDGGGIFLGLSGAKIIYNHITGNHLTDTVGTPPTYVSGAGIGTAGEQCNVWVVVDHNVIDHNSCFGSCDQIASAGMEVWYNARITNNTFSWNTLTGTGNCSAVAAGFCGVSDATWAVPGTVIAEHNIISHNLVQAENNYASAAGALFQSVNSYIEDNIIEGNKVITWNNSGGGSGMNIYIPLGQTLIRGNMFRDNISDLWTGALHLETFFADPAPNTVVVENNYFIDNEAKSGGAFGSLGSPVVLRNNVFSGNHASGKGGAAYLDITTPASIEHKAILINNSFSGNSADIYGGAIYSTLKNLLVINSIFWKDTSNSASGQEIYALNGLGDTLELANSNIDQTKVRGIIVDGGGNINEDPLFDDPVTLIPKNWSPCVESGAEAYICLCGDTHYAPAYDIRGFVRPTGAGYDMGAYDLEGWGMGTGRITNYGLRITSNPNPFTTSTTLNYTLNKPSNVVIQIYNSFGQEIAEPVNAFQQKGEQKVIWNAGNLPSGMYYYRIEAGGLSGTGKIIRQ
jgi:predicted outer membrane repeat protein